MQETGENARKIRMTKGQNRIGKNRKNRQVTNMDQKQNDDKILRMKELHRQLLAASRAYYQESREIMSNFEYDRLYDELLELEKETGTVLGRKPDPEGGLRGVKRAPEGGP